MKNVAVLTTFFDINEFSLITVTATQIGMLLDNGHNPTVLVSEGTYRETEKGQPLPPVPFEEVPLPSVWNSQTVDLRPVFPALKLIDGVAEDFEQRVERIVGVLEENLAEIDVAITHEFIAQKTHKEYNVAMRCYAKTRPDLLWLHWIHSRPVPVDGIPSYPLDCRYSPPPGYIVYPNEVEKSHVVQTYNLGGQEWRVQSSRSGHALDPLRILPLHPLTKELATKADLLGGEISAIYPARLDRGKQPEKIIRLFKGIQKARWDPRLLIIPFQSMGERFREYVGELHALIRSLHMEGKVFFSDQLSDECSQGVPNRVIHELLGLTTVYVNPSSTETYGIPVHEAMLHGVLAVLNHDLLPMRELYGKAALYMDFGSDTNPREYQPSEQRFWNDEAMRLIAELSMNRALMAKMWAYRRWSPAVQWKNFAPLLYLPPVGAE